MASGIIYKNGILNDHQNPFLESQNFEFNTPEKSLAKIVSKKEQKITREELRKLISRGLVLPSFLDNILEELPEIDKEQLFKNMKKYNTDAKQILKLINSGFDAASVLKQLSSDKKVYVDALYSHVTNNKFKDFMLRHGFEEERAEEEDDEYAGLNFLINSSLRKTDKKIEPKGENGLIHKYNTANLAVGSDKVKHKRRFTYNIYGEKVYDYDEDGNFEDFSEMEKYDELGQKRGKVVHFLPSEQMKLIKDYQQKREVKNVFLNRLFLKQTVPLQYPNFSPNVEVRDTTPKLPEKFPNGTRFNEPLKGRAYPRINHKKREEEIFLQNLYNKQHQQNSRKIFKDKSTMNGSSKMIFNPERYFNARGLNIIFEDTEKVKEKKPPAALYRGRVFAAPVVYRQEGHIRDSLIVGKSAIVTPNQYDLNLLP
ncbi:hypothetical protein HDU92_004426 [Lobulomyces angularis]|nr:hypothetical protein HDU92_004426 [Lobulomyces angularis]